MAIDKSVKTITQNTELDAHYLKCRKPKQKNQRILNVLCYNKVYLCKHFFFF